MKEQVITCDRCGKVFSGDSWLEIALDHQHPLVRNWMKHGTIVYLSLQASIHVSSKVDSGWKIEQDLCADCLKSTILEIIG